MSEQLLSCLSGVKSTKVLDFNTMNKAFNNFTNGGEGREGAAGDKEGANHVWVREGARLQVTTGIELYAGEGVEAVGGKVKTGSADGLVTGQGGLRQALLPTCAILAALSSPSSCPTCAPVWRQFSHPHPPLPCHLPLHTVAQPTGTALPPACGNTAASGAASMRTPATSTMTCCGTCLTLTSSTECGTAPGRSRLGLEAAGTESLTYPTPLEQVQPTVDTARRGSRLALGGLGGCALKHRFSIGQPCRVLAWWMS